jgi:hypothetical protein
MRARFLIPLVVSLAFAAAGCGGAAGGGPEGAAEAPANALFFVAIDTDFESEQWDNARTLVGKFPDGDRAVDFLLEQLSEEGVDFEADVKPALGPEVVVVGFDLAAGENNIVGLTKPKDEQKLRELLEKGDEPVVVRRIGDWTAFAESDLIIDRFMDARDDGRLADEEDFQDAMDTVSDDALVHAYFNGKELTAAAQQGSEVSPEALEACVPGGETPSVAFAVRAESDGVRFEGGGKALGGDEAGYFSPYESELVDVVPGGVLAYLSFNDLDQLFSTLRDCLGSSSPEFEQGLAQFEAILGVSLEEDIAPLFANEGAFYVRRGVPFPEVTLLLSVDDEARAEQTIDDLIAGLRMTVAPDLGPAEPTNVGGVTVNQVRIPDAPVSLFYGGFDGRLVLTTARDGVAALREEGDRFADDELFQQAQEDADMPDETVGFFFVNLQETVEYALGFAEVADEDVPDEVGPNLEPLEHLLLYGTEDGETSRFGGFLAIE